jgi:hypothetical protein
MNRLLTAGGLFAFVFLLPGISRANAYSDLVAMRNAFNAAKTWHAVENMPNGRKVTVDFQAPDRWRIVNPAMTELLIGDTVYMVRNGHATQIPMMGGMIQSMLNAFKYGAYDADVKASARDLGMKPLNGRMLHAYSFTTKGTPVTMYVAANHLPVQSVVKGSNGTTTIVYSAWNSPIRISP